MSRRKRSHTSNEPAVPAAGDAVTSAAASGGRGRVGRKSWLATHGRDLRFLLLFTVLMVGYYVLMSTSTAQDRFLPWYLEVTARMAGGVVHLFGYDEMVVSGKVLRHPGGSISVERGCDALDPSALFVSAVLASPLPFFRRLSAAVAGTLVLMALNLFRIITLFLTRVHWRDAFDVMHLDVWQSAFILLAIVLWALWATWESRRRRMRLRPHAPA